MKGKVLFAVIALMIIAFAGYLLRVAFVGDPLDEMTQVRDLRLTQEGLEVTANWGELDCDGYEVKVWRDGRLTVIPKVEDNTYTIEGVYPGERCVVKVNAHLKHGWMSRSAEEVLIAGKVDQNIMVDNTVYYGFEGNDFKLKASANGDVHYRSADKSIAAVDKSGKVTLGKTGETEILMRVEGNGLFNDAERTVSVIVYPPVLDKVKGIAVENISPTRAVVRWKPDEYAAAYKVLRKNPATQEYEEIVETPAEVTYFEVTRNDYDYGIKGIAEVNGEKVDGKLSDPVAVRGTTAEAKAYSAFKIVRKLDAKNLDVVAEIDGDELAHTPQSLSIIGDQYVVAYVNKDCTEGRLISYKKSDGSLTEKKKANGIRHGNGSAYNPNTNRLYVLSTKNGEDSKKCYVFDAQTKKLLDKIDMPVVTSAIAYDISTDKFYLAKADKMYVCDSNFKVEKTLTKTAPFVHTQDIGAYNGAIFVCTWPQQNESYIDIYRASDGAYLGSYDVSLGEIEGCAIEDGYLVILMNTIGSFDDKIYRTKERIAIP